jgi:hypothetical protein
MERELDRLNYEAPSPDAESAGLSAIREVLGGRTYLSTLKLPVNEGKRRGQAPRASAEGKHRGQAPRASTESTHLIDCRSNPSCLNFCPGKGIVIFYSHDTSLKTGR